MRADAQRNRQRILAAAGELFAERGIAVSLDEIARRAGVGTGTAYRRFDSKDALIEAVMVDRIQELAVVAAECLDDPDPWCGLEGYLERTLALMADDRGLHDAVFSTCGAEGLEQARRALAPAVARLVERAIDAQVVRSDLAASDVPVIIFMLTAFADQRQLDEPMLYRRCLAIVLDGLRHRGDPR